VVRVHHRPLGPLQGFGIPRLAAARQEGETGTLGHARPRAARAPTGRLSSVAIADIRDAWAELIGE
jgi:hypothetical protein